MLPEELDRFLEFARSFDSRGGHDSVRTFDGEVSFVQVSSVRQAAFVASLEKAGESSASTDRCSIKEGAARVSVCLSACLFVLVDCTRNVCCVCACKRTYASMCVCVCLCVLV